MTVYMEAGGEPHVGKLGVAYVIVNRATQWHLSIPDVCFNRYQFSCWNTGSLTRMQLDRIVPEVWDACVTMSHGAISGTVPDPTFGATHYLNIELTKKIRGGTLPPWFREDRITTVLGQHTFLKL